MESDQEFDEVSAEGTIELTQSGFKWIFDESTSSEENSSGQVVSFKAVEFLLFASQASPDGQQKPQIYFKVALSKYQGLFDFLLREQQIDNISKFKESFFAQATEDEEINCTLIPSDRSQVAKLSSHINHILTLQEKQSEPEQDTFYYSAEQFEAENQNMDFEIPAHIQLIEPEPVDEEGMFDND